MVCSFAPSTTCAGWFWQLRKDVLRHWLTRGGPQTTASELYYLKHQRSCACCSRGKGSSHHMPQSVTQSLFEALGWSQSAEQRFIGVANLVRLYAHTAARVGVQTVRLWQQVHERCPTFLGHPVGIGVPPGRSPHATGMSPCASRHTHRTARAATLLFSYELCSSLVGPRRVPLVPSHCCRCLCLDLAPPSPWTTERLSGASGARLLLGIWHGRGGSGGRRSSRTPRSSRLGSALDTDPGAVPHRNLTQALAVTDVDMGEVPSRHRDGRRRRWPRALCLLCGTPGRQSGCEMASMWRSGASLPRFVRNSVPTDAPCTFPPAGYGRQRPSRSSSVYPVP